MKRTVIGAAAAAIFGLALQTGGANAAPTSVVACGNITTPGSYLVANNIISPGGDCIVIEANLVTLDLGGFTIAKSGGAAGDGVSTPFGSDIRGTVVRNGTITFFSNGVELSNAGSGTTIEGIRAIANTGNGILVPSNSTVTGNIAHANAGRGISAADGCTVIHNAVTESGFEGIVAGQGSNVIENTSRDNVGDGILVTCEANVIGNTSTSNGGIALNLLFAGCNSVNNVAVP